MTERAHGAEWEAAGAEGCGEPPTRTAEPAASEPERASHPQADAAAPWPRAAGGGAAGVAAEVRVVEPPAAEAAAAPLAEAAALPPWPGSAVALVPDWAPPAPEATDAPVEAAPLPAEQPPLPRLPEQSPEPPPAEVVAVDEVPAPLPARPGPEHDGLRQAEVLPQPAAVATLPAQEPSSSAHPVQPAAFPRPAAATDDGVRPLALPLAQEATVGGERSDPISLAPPRPAPRRYGRYVRTALRAAALAVAALCVLLLALVVLYRWVDPPMSSLMLGQRLTGTPIAQRWVPLSRISPNLQLAAIVSEDARFCRHAGVDWGELMEAIESVGDGVARGGSTISMQVVKNLFLWPSRSYLRKAIEIPLAYLIEAAWGKPRILEIYLNIAEWGPGVFGAEVAARYHFRKPASQLTPREAALLAVSLPNPFERQAGSPGPGTARLADTLLARMRAGQAHAACVRNRTGGG